MALLLDLVDAAHLRPSLPSGFPAKGTATEAVYMRELVLITVVAALCLTALVKPRIGLYGYIWFALMQPDALAWAYGAHPLSLALAVSTLLGSIRFAPNLISIARNPIVQLLLALQAPVLLSVVFAHDPSLSSEPLRLYARVIVMALLIPVLVRSQSDLRELLLITSLSIGLLGAKFGVYGLLRGGVAFSAGNAGFL